MSKINIALMSATGVLKDAVRGNSLVIIGITKLELAIM
jgi:hypothetical protein